MVLMKKILGNSLEKRYLFEEFVSRKLGRGFLIVDISLIFSSFAEEPGVNLDLKPLLEPRVRWLLDQWKPPG